MGLESSAIPISDPIHGDKLGHDAAAESIGQEEFALVSGCLEGTAEMDTIYGHHGPSSSSKSGMMLDVSGMRELQAQADAQAIDSLEEQKLVTDVDTLRPQRNTAPHGSWRKAEPGSAQQESTLKFRSSAIRPSKGPSGDNASAPLSKLMIKRINSDAGGLCITPSPPTPSIPPLNLARIRKQKYSNKNPTESDGVISLATFPRRIIGNEDNCPSDYEHEISSDRHGNIDVQQEASQAVHSVSMTYPYRYPSCKAKASPRFGSMSGRYTIPYRQIGRQAPGASGQNLYSAIRSLHVANNQRNSNAQIVDLEDPWLSSWRTNGQSIGKSPRQCFFPNSNDKCTTTAPVMTNSHDLHAALDVRPISVPDNEGDCEKLGSPKQLTSSPKQPYGRRRARSMPACALMPISFASYQEKSLAAQQVSKNDYAFNSLTVGGVTPCPKAGYSNLGAGSRPCNSIPGYSVYGSSGFASEMQRQLPFESAGMSTEINCSAVELNKKAWKRPAGFTGKMVTTTPRQGPFTGAHAVHVHRRPRSQGWNWKSSVPAEDVDMGPGRYEHVRWPVNGKPVGSGVCNSIGGGYMSRLLDSTYS